MKKTCGILVCLFFVSMFLTLPAFGTGDSGAAAKSAPAGQSATLEKAGELSKSKDLADLKQALELYEKALEENPDNFQAAWGAAAASREYASQAHQQEVENWKDICAEIAKKGMGYAQQAIALKPDKPHGYYYYGLNVAAYSDGVGVLTAIKEGLKNKTQENLEKAYEIDKTFDSGGPVLALGRFWQRVPWPYNDKDKAMKYYRELQKSPFFGDKVQHYIFPAEILADQWGEEPKQEARQLLEQALKKTDDPFWQNHAKELLEDV